MKVGKDMIYEWAKSILFRMDAEKAHHLVVNSLSKMKTVPGALPLLRRLYEVPRADDLSMQVCGLSFPHPIGLSAGLDKNGVAAEAWEAMGFGFIEVGTVTPKAQSGNDLPRLFRLPEDYALINRMGFNNVGAEAMKANLEHTQLRVPLWINIGKNKVTPNERAHEDYVSNLQRLYAYGEAFVVNVSSPNTPGLRDLQTGNDMARLLAAVREAREAIVREHAGFGRKPLFVKIAPDLTDEQLADTVLAIQSSSIDGIVATNTTLSRAGLQHGNQWEAGGLSGKPLQQRSTQVIRELYGATGGSLPIIGSGGIFTADDAYDKIRAGASLVQIYTGFVYQGPALVKQIAQGMRVRMKADGFQHISQAVGQ